MLTADGEDFEIPAFLQDPNKIVNQLADDADDEAFDSPTLDDEVDDDPTGLDVFAAEVAAEADKPVAAPKEEKKPGKKAKPTDQPPVEPTGGNSGVAGDQVRAIIERVERLEEEKKTIADDIKEVFAGAKGTGFDVKTIRKIIALRKKDQAERAEEEALLDLYLFALGMN